MYDHSFCLDTDAQVRQMRRQAEVDDAAVVAESYCFYCGSDDLEYVASYERDGFGGQQYRPYTRCNTCGEIAEF